MLLQPNEKQIVIQPKVICTEQLEQRLDGKNEAAAKKKKAPKKQKKKKSAPSKSSKTGGGTDDENLTQQFTHVQFQFDDYSPPAPEPPDESLKITEENDFNGNYDILPLDPTPTLDNNRNEITRSTESIPFIDEGDSVSRQASPRFESRFITLIPKNFEGHSLVRPPTLQSFAPLNKYQESPPKPPRAAQLRILPKIEEQKDETHKFQYYYNPGYKVCQICHLYLHVCPAIKCFECEFVCHQQCFDKVSEV